MSWQSNRPVTAVLEKLDRVRKSSDTKWTARCPAHEDRNPSLSVAEGDDGRVLLKCFAGCSLESIVAAIGLQTADLFVDDGSRKGSDLVAEYPYVDEHGEILYVVERVFPKTFRQKRPNGRGGWIYKLNGVRRVPYRLPQILAASERGETVYVVEGEKDVAAIERLGLTATTNSGGAGKWRGEFAKHLSGAEVVVVADADDAGRKHAAQVAASVRRYAKSVSVVEPVEGKDVADHVAAGRTLEELVPLRADVSPAARRLSVVRAIDVRAEPLRFLFDGRIVCGMLNLVTGPPGVGKSTILYDFHARVSREGHNVLIVTGEDHHAAVVRPRLELAGADLARVLIVNDDLSLPDDIERLAGTVRDYNAALFSIDPLVAFLGTRIDTHKDSSVRQALKPLTDVAQETGAAAAVVLHTNKSSSDDPLQRLNGTIGFSGAGRQVLLASGDPEDETGQRRYLAVSKSNVAAFAPTLAYTIETGTVPGPEGEAVPTSRVRWGEECPEVDARMLLRRPDDYEEKGAVGEAMAMLRAELADGPRRAEEINRVAAKLKISDSTLKRAKSRLGVKSEPFHDGEQITHWTWRLRDDVVPRQEDHPPSDSLGLVALTSENGSPGGLADQEGPTAAQPASVDDQARAAALVQGELGGVVVEEKTTAGAESEPRPERINGKPLGGELFVLAAASEFPRVGLPDGTTILGTEECWRTFCKAALPHDRAAAFRTLMEAETGAS